MQVFLKILWEGIVQAVQQLVSHKLRTTLSLLGITIGILCVISVLSAVSSLEFNIRSSFEQLGDDVVYVNRFNWGENPAENWFKIMRRPEPNYEDYEAIVRNVRSYQNVAYSSFMGSKSIEYLSSNASNVFLIGITYDYAEVFKLKFGEGRYFSLTEYNNGTNTIVLGAEVAKGVFGENVNPIGKKVKIFGRKMVVIGVLEKTGKSLVNPLDFDKVAFIPFYTAKRIMDLSKEGDVMVKAAEGATLEQLKDELTSVIRRERRLKPAEENNFALNELSILSTFFDAFFGTLNIAGWIIGGFSLIVGGFSVANIMFVSVRERTNIIGVKKALGAKNYFILLEFLVESIILCILGGILGLGLVYGLAELATAVSDFEFFLSRTSIILGIIVSVVIGVIAGLIPALQAAKMDPVEAMRQ
jgi:putative ABC transport system permease protein